jgi:hypothetical protein
LILYVISQVVWLDNLSLEQHYFYKFYV